MDDRLAVRGTERRERLADDACKRPEGKRAIAAEQRPERRAVKVLHHDVRRPIGEAPEIEHVDDPLVTDHVDRARLVEEPLDEVGICRRFDLEHLDRDARTDRRLHCEIHPPHAARSEQPRDPP